MRIALVMIIESLVNFEQSIKKRNKTNKYKIDICRYLLNEDKIDADTNRSRLNKMINLGK